MPQMAPMPWITLMISTMLALFLMITLIYFNFSPKSKYTSPKIKTNFLIKW